MTPPGDDDLGIGAIRRSGESAPIDAAESVDRLEGAGAVQSVAPAEAAATADPEMRLEAITASLSNGEISAAEAQALLIDHVVASSLSPGADAALIDAVKSEVTAMLAADPTLAALLNPNS